MTVDLTIIVPTRSRPDSVPRVVDAWVETGAFDEGAELLFVVDDDDPDAHAYHQHIRAATAILPVGLIHAPTWRPLVPKLNEAALAVAELAGRFAIGFAGDDHLPRTPGWAAAYLRYLREAGAGVVSCPDGYRADQLPTQWVMTSDIVWTLGGMVPAPVEHLYCDNVVWDIAEAAGCYGYLPEHLIEHMHPVAGKARSDEQYDRVNSRPQYKSDRRAYSQWREQPTGLARDAALVRKLIEQGVPA